MANLHLLTDNSPEVLAGRGQNIIPPPAKEPLWRGFLRKFADPLIIVLGIVFVLSVGVALYEIYYTHSKGFDTLLEPLGVLIAMLLATGVGFIFEVKADREFDILNQVKDSRKVRCLRRRDADDTAGRICEIARQDVCVGDIVVLEGGDEVPADGRLIKAQNMHVDESAFTGEPQAAKAATGTFATKEDDEAAYPKDFLLRGSTIIEGNGLMVITAVGMATEEGKGAKAVEEGSSVQTPLNQQLSRLGHLISIASFVIGGLIIVGRMALYFSANGLPADNASLLATTEAILDSLMIAVTLIVVAVPEGLPMSITVSLALSMRKMLRENNLVRRLHACETMGAATVICTDKTGTLTQNKMTVVAEEWHCPDTVRCKSIAINSTASLSLEAGEGAMKVIGNPTEGALLRRLHEAGCDYRPLRIDSHVTEQVPFSTALKYMSTTTEEQAEGQPMLRTTYLKGAPEMVLAQCESLGGFASREAVLSTLRGYQQQAMRTLAFAVRTEGATQSPMTLIGIVGIADPLREDVKAAIDICTNHAGVRVIIVTGDTALTAAEIGRQLGLDMSHEAACITGADFAALSDEAALAMLRAKRLKVMSRARPTDKARLVELLQRLDEVVAVTGDGTNDAPALAKAQVGLSMGDGTARAKEASDITIIDNSFSSINSAILWGRSLYQNIRRFIVFQVTVNVCACLIVLLGAFLDLESPLTVTQMLWVNLIMDTFAAMALSSLPADPKVMEEKPRSPRAHIVDRVMISYILLTAVPLFLGLGLLWQMGFHHCFFTVFVMLQFWNLFNVRYYATDRTLWGDLGRILRREATFTTCFGKGFISIAGIILLGQVLIVHGAGQMFQTTPLTLHEWLVIIAGTAAVLLLPIALRCIPMFRFR